jgi:hypothetical protein
MRVMRPNLNRWVIVNSNKFDFVLSKSRFALSKSRFVLSKLEVVLCKLEVGHKFVVESDKLEAGMVFVVVVVQIVFAADV